jgi:hypothetical protein
MNARPADRAPSRRGLGARGAQLTIGLAVLFTLGLCGCSRQKLVVASTAPVIDAALAESFASGDVETVRRGLPGQILLLRGLCRSDPGHLGVWTTTVQLYASYGLLFIGDQDPEYAARLYAEGREVGVRFLRRIDWLAAAWDEGPDALRAALAERQPDELAALLFWTAACLGEHVLHNQDKPREMIDLPYVHVLLEAAIELDGDYFYGMPYLMKGVMLATIPRGLGGNLGEAQQYFDAALEISGGRFLLHQVFYARHLCVAALDEEQFVERLEAVLAAPGDALPEMRFVNRIARQRAAALLEMREEFF